MTRWFPQTAAIAIGFACATAVAQDSDLAVACRGIADSSARLACYDRAVGAPEPAAPASEAANAHGPAEMAPVATVPPGNGSVRQQPVPLPMPQRSPPPGGSGDLMDLRITAISVTASGRHRFRLANGQLWEQIEPRATDLDQGDVVSVTETLFGAWSMREHEGAARSFKVRRLE